jgi:hypothetical protein
MDFFCKTFNYSISLSTDYNHKKCNLLKKNWPKISIPPLLQLDDDVNDIICYKKDPTQPNWKIALPKSMVADTIKWFHQAMGHTGKKDYVRR